jgi:S1-C subfamily serine protease
VIESIEVLPTPNSEVGLKIADLYDGAAKKAALREGDIIVAVGKARVRSFNELVLSLANVTGPVEVTYVAGSSGKVEKTIVTPVEGKIGVGVVPADLR